MNSFVISNSRERKRAMFRYMRETKQTFEQFMLQWGGVMVHDLIDYTPPRPKKGVKASWAKQKAAGMAAVERDIRKIFFGPDQLLSVLGNLQICKNDPKLLERLTNYVNGGDTDKLLNVLTSLGMSMKLIEAPSRDLHFPQRNYRGIVRKPKQRYYLTKEQPIKGYIAEIQKDVGKLKSGWMTAANSIGLKVRDVPKWVTRHREPGKGDLNLKGPNYFIEVVNKAKASKDHSPNDIVAPAMRILERKFMKSLKAIQAHNAAKFNAPF